MHALCMSVCMYACMHYACLSVCTHACTMHVCMHTQVWNHNRIMDDFVAQARCEEEATETGEEKILNLYGRKKEAATVLPGTMIIFLRTSTDLTLL